MINDKLFATLLLAATSMSLSATERDTIRINNGWMFHRGDISEEIGRAHV